MTARNSANWTVRHRYFPSAFVRFVRWLGKFSPWSFWWLENGKWRKTRFSVTKILFVEPSRTNRQSFGLCCFVCEIASCLHTKCLVFFFFPTDRRRRQDSESLSNGKAIFSILFATTAFYCSQSAQACFSSLGSWNGEWLYDSEFQTHDSHQCHALGLKLIFTIQGLFAVQSLRQSWGSSFRKKVRSYLARPLNTNARFLPLCCFWVLIRSIL